MTDICGHDWVIDWRQKKRIGYWVCKKCSKNEFILTPDTMVGLYATLDHLQNERDALKAQIDELGGRKW